MVSACLKHDRVIFLGFLYSKPMVLNLVGQTEPQQVYN